jgi:hypothetical protein
MPITTGQGNFEPDSNDFEPLRPSNVCPDAAYSIAGVSDDKGIGIKDLIKYIVGIVSRGNLSY